MMRDRWKTPKPAVVAAVSLLPALAPPPARAAAGPDWGAYLGDAGSSQYSTLNQVNRGNVARLERAWEFRSGDARKGRSQIQCNPVIVGGVLYGTTPGLRLVALDAASGEERWRFDPFAREGAGQPGGINRGVVYWASEGGGERRVLFAAGHFLYAVDAGSGRPVDGFGQGGRVDLKRGLGRDVSRLSLVSKTPGVVFENLIYVPVSVGEGPGPTAPGHIRAYDIRTGEQVWRFNTIPHPGEFGHETWPADAWKEAGGANVWTGMALDRARGLLYCPTGSPAFDFWGGNRMGQNLFGNCLIALDARTGERRWHYQFVHHDLWDRDLPTPPNLLTVRQGGRAIDAVAQVTKSGHVFVFDRVTGEPLFPVEERAVPASDLDGESAWPTQPVPARPAAFSRQLFSYDEVTDISPASRRAVLERFVKVRPHALYMPPSTAGTIIFPGFDGGGEWGGAAADPEGVLYVNGNEMPWILTMVPSGAEGGGLATTGGGLYRQICAACHGPTGEGNAAHNVPSLAGLEKRMKRADFLALLAAGKGVMPSFAFLSGRQRGALADHLLGAPPGDPRRGDGAARPAPAGEDAGAATLGKVPFGHTGYNRWLDPEGYPAVKPPWGTLNAIDLNSGDFLWRVPLGEFPELTARGIPPTGTENYGGPVVTAGGLVFIAATKDEKFRAFDRRSGHLLWETSLPAGGYATPATYLANGKQYVVIACGGGKMGTKSGDSYVAFALPD